MIFLGGTCGNNHWRDRFIERLTQCGVPREAIFNPVVADWNEEAQAREDHVKCNCDYMLFYLADPMQPDNHNSFYSLAEAIMGLYDSPDRTIVVFDSSYMPDFARKSNDKAYQDLKTRFPNANIFASLEEAAQFFIGEYT